MRILCMYCICVGLHVFVCVCVCVKALYTWCLSVPLKSAIVEKDEKLKSVCCWHCMIHLYDAMLTDVILCDAVLYCNIEV